MLKSLIALGLSLGLLVSAHAEEAKPDAAQAAVPQMKMSLEQTVVKHKISSDISMDDAVESMKLRANSLNMKLVAHLPLSEELKAQSVPDVRRMEIFQFCDAQIAKKMVDADMSFAAYLPCRITLLEDKEGQGWLVMLNMDLIMEMVTLPGELQSLAMKVRDNMNSILSAGANGEL